MNTLPIALQNIRTKLARIADGLALALAVSLPWSTSASIALGLLWLGALILTLQWGEVRRVLAKPAGAFPVALFALACAGMTWAGTGVSVGWPERLGGLDSFFKLIAIPLLFIQFSRSGRGAHVLVGYLASCTALLALSWLLVIRPENPLMTVANFGVPVKGATTQTFEFIGCAVALLFVAAEFFRLGRRILAGGVFVLALLFLADVFLITPWNAELTLVQAMGIGVIALPLLFAMLGLKVAGTRGMFVLAAVGLVLSSVMLISIYRRDTSEPLVQLPNYLANFHRWGVERPEFWDMSVKFIAAAPVFGHGTGSVNALFVQATSGVNPPAVRVTNNVHQQTLGIGIQLGFVGMAALWAMWISHLHLLRGRSWPAFAGLVVVVQTMTGSLVDSYLFNFTQGWIYVLAVGVTGGMVLRARTESAPTSAT